MMMLMMMVMMDNVDDVNLMVLGINVNPPGQA